MQIFDLVFDLGDVLHRQFDLLRVWDAGLMTSGEAKLLSDLFFAEDDGDTLVQIYRELFDEELDLSGLGGRVPAELSVALVRLATNIDAIARLGTNNRRMAARIEQSEGAFKPQVEDWAEVYDELAEISRRPSPCLDSTEDRVRFLQVTTTLVKRIVPLETFAGYDQAEFASAIEMARARAAGEA
jgi:hypothetical protein